MPPKKDCHKEKNNEEKTDEKTQLKNANAEHHSDDAPVVTPL